MKSILIHAGASGFVLAALLLAGNGCSGKADAASSLPDSVFAAQIPLFPGARYESAMGGSYYAAIGGPATSRSQSWFFKVSEPAEKVVAFYGERLPQAERSTDDEETRFEFEPRDAKPGEKVRVTIRPGQLQITERLSAERPGGEE